MIVIYSSVSVRVSEFCKHAN